MPLAVICRTYQSSAGRLPEIFFFLVVVAGVGGNYHQKRGFLGGRMPSKPPCAGDRVTRVSEGQDMRQPITAEMFTDFLLSDMQGLAAILAETRRTT